MKIILAGGSGQIGTHLSRNFHDKGHEVVILSRNPRERPWVEIDWDAATQGSWSSELEDADVLINLVGKSVDCRYTDKNKEIIMQSRIQSTRVLVNVVQKLENPPKVFLQMSTATIYAHSFDNSNDEVDGVLGGNEDDVPEKWNFSIDVASSWEAEFNKLISSKIRKVILRSAIVMTPDHHGPLHLLIRLAKYGLGGNIAGGRQYISWIHINDFQKCIEWIIDNEDFSGIVNLSSPNPIIQSEFMRILRQELGVRIGLPATSWMVKLGCFFLRTEAELALKSRKVISSRLKKEGFVFDLPNWTDAAKDLIALYQA